MEEGNFGWTIIGKSGDAEFEGTDKSSEIVEQGHSASQIGQLDEKPEAGPGCKVDAQDGKGEASETVDDLVVIGEEKIDPRKAFAFGELVHSEVRKILFGEEESLAEVEPLEEDRILEQGQKQAGLLWRVSLIATLGFVGWALMGGAGKNIRCLKPYPTIKERERSRRFHRRKTKEAQFADAS